jgi:hypothetical protein
MGETVTIRIEFSSQEAEALEKWRAAHNLASLDDAVRRLTRLGLRVAEGSSGDDDLEAAAD